MSIKKSSIGGRVAAGSAAFTLIETLVAIGAVALLAVAIAAVFDATGKTVGAGQRVSRFHTYASMIEQQMRRDFDRMTRDGFLLIRHEYANTADNQPLSAIELYPGQPAASQRPRRIDQIGFYARGPFTSAREPLVPGFTAQSNEAQIWYGHGQRMVKPQQYSTADHYYRPGFGDTNADPNGTLGYRQALPPIINPNRYASDWTLLRHVTLLCPPGTNPRAQPVLPPAWGVAVNRLPDSENQVSFQPAATYLSGYLSERLPSLVQAQLNSVGWTGARPLMSSGIVDCATTDLWEVRTLAEAVPTTPAITRDADLHSALLQGADARLQSQLGPAAMAAIQFWMRDSLPGTLDALTAPAYLNRPRMRYEDAPTDYVGVLTDPNLTPLNRAIARANQLMLTASNFVPHCSEFIVEWSFGRVDNDTGVAPPGAMTNDLVWHGIERSVDEDGMFSAPGVNTRPIARPYPLDSRRPNPGVPSRLFAETYRKQDGTTGSVGAQVNLIHGTPPANREYGPLTAYFGYTDPTFNPDLDPPGGNGVLTDPADSATPTAPWPWPRLIRITMTLSDPTDPKVEETYQFVFPTPGNPAQ